MPVCFICTSRNVLDGHRVCAEHHVPAMCRTCRGSATRHYTKPTTKVSVHTAAALDALAALGGQATSRQIADVLGITGNQVRAGLDAAPNVRYERDGMAAAVWTLDEAA